MHSLMIIDSDRENCRILHDMLENSNIKFENIFECCNGMEALSTALPQPPDICIVEVKLPDLSGFELIRQLRVLNPHCKYIMVTSYGYFDHAVQALQVSAADILLKPVKKDRLLAAMRRISEEIDKENYERTQQKKITDLLYVLEKRILKELVTSQIDEETLWFFEAMDFEWPYFCICFVRIEKELSEQEQEQISRRLRKELTEIGYQHLLYAHKGCIDLMIFSQIKAYTEEILANTKTIFQNVFLEAGIQIKFGSGTWESDFMQSEFSHLQAKKAVGESVSADQNGIRMEQIENDMVRIQKKMNVPPEVLQICDYIQNNYSEKITLNSIADQAGFSKYYISRLFKQYTGVTIIDYLIKIRLDKAKELLVKGEYNIKQISYMVGYSDPNYFTWSFKKYLGISPVKYKYFQNLNH